MGKTPILKFVQDMYGIKMRKGINKLHYEHFLDVLQNSHLDCISSQERQASLFKVCLLHDILEDFDEYSPKDLYKMLDISKRDIEILLKLSRNYSNEDYIIKMFGDEDAVIVKMADRISNMYDLIAWIEKRGFNYNNTKITKKYLKENKSMLDNLKSKYPNFLKMNVKISHPFLYQYNKLIMLTNKLAKFYESQDYLNEVKIEDEVKKEMEYDKDVDDEIEEFFRELKKIFDAEDEDKEDNS